MTTSLLELPPEILIGVLCLLPLRDLLKFSETSQYARSLTNANLHTLTLDFCSIHNTQKPSSYASARRLQALSASLKPYQLQIPTPPESLHPCDRPLQINRPKPTNPHLSTIKIPDARSHTYQTLTTFQSALTQSILTRHAIGLRHLNLTIWALTLPIARAITHLTALKSLSITITHCPYTRAVPRSCVMSQRHEERKAWDLLSEDSGMNVRLRKIEIVDAELDVNHLLKILKRSPYCRSLALSRCRFLGAEMWAVLGREWVGWRCLEELKISECGGVLDSRAFEAIGQMKNLRLLDLYGCVGMSCDEVEEWNRDHWGIAQVIAPKRRGVYEDETIEVDPDYMEHDD